MKQFYLGTHQTSWLGHLSVPLFISHRRLRERSRFRRRAIGPWALDSGGFSELSMHGGWRTTVNEYVDAARRYSDELGRLDWAAPMDWMCEPPMLAQTGLSVDRHQALTVENVSVLRAHAPDVPWICVLQGWELADYVRCIERYARAGIDVTSETVVGVGSVCRRQASQEIADIFAELAAAGVSCHGFGVKTLGLARYAEHVFSVDSMAWSFEARRTVPLAGCHHKACNNCPRYALAWRERLLRQLGVAGLHPRMTLAAPGARPQAWPESELRACGGFAP